jgi:hypothetical protein
VCSAAVPSDFRIEIPSKLTFPFQEFCAHLLFLFFHNLNDIKHEGSEKFLNAVLKQAMVLSTMPFLIHNVCS